MKRISKPKLHKTDMCRRCRGGLREISPPSVYCTQCREILALRIKKKYNMETEESQD